jgi:hypothetical protein
VIPQHLAEEVAEEAFEQTAFEDFVQDQVEQGRSIFGIYPPGPEARGVQALARSEPALSTGCKLAPPRDCGAPDSG